MSIKEYWISYKTLVNKEWMRILRIWPQTLLPSVITISLYFLIFGKVMFLRVNEMDGFKYLHFITPGLIIMSLINNSYSNVVSSFFSAKFCRSIEELLISPTPNFLIILGYISGGVFRGIFVGFLVSFIAFAFSGFSLYVYSIKLVFVSFLCCSILFALGGLLNAILAQKFDDTSIFTTFILTSLIYLGGVFYSINMLPPFWQNMTKINPLFYIIDFARFAFLGYSLISPCLAFICIFFFIVLLYSLVLYLLSSGIKLKS